METVYVACVEFIASFLVLIQESSNGFSFFDELYSVTINQFNHVPKIRIVYPKFIWKLL